MPPARRLWVAGFLPLGADAVEDEEAGEEGCYAARMFFRKNPQMLDTIPID